MDGETGHLEFVGHFTCTVTTEVDGDYARKSERADGQQKAEDNHQLDPRGQVGPLTLGQTPQAGAVTWRMAGGK